MSKASIILEVRQQLIIESKEKSSHHDVFKSLGLKHAGTDDEPDEVYHTYTESSSKGVNVGHVHKTVENMGYHHEESDHDSGGSLHYYSHPKTGHTITVSHDDRGMDCAVTHSRIKE